RRRGSPPGRRCAAPGRNRVAGDDRGLAVDDGGARSRPGARGARESPASGGAQDTTARRRVEPLVPLDQTVGEGSRRRETALPECPSSSKNGCAARQMGDTIARSDADPRNVDEDTLTPAPLRHPEASGRLGVQLQAAAPTGERLILLAEDDEDILDLVSFRLERSGYRIVRARDGAEAVLL